MPLPPLDLDFFPSGDVFPTIGWLSELGGMFFPFLCLFFVRVGGVLCVCVVCVFVGRGLDE